MLLAANPSFEFIRFMQILVWIILPVLLSAIAFTVFFHYRKKKKVNPMSEDAENRFVLASPEQFRHKKSDGDYVFFDHSGLIHEYKKRMFYNHARYTALRNDYARLEAKYSSLLTTDKKDQKKRKKIYMKNHNDQTPLVDANLMTEDLAKEKNELTDNLVQLSRSYQRLEEENRFLQEQISLQTAGDDEKDKIMNRWKEENKALREKTAEQDYLEELLNEKKAQIVFLQNQLEERIRNQHHADQQRQQATSGMNDLLQQVEALKNELLLKQETADKLQMSLCEKEEQLTEKQQVLGSKLDHITYLENVLHETKEQNELLNAELADRKDEVQHLQQLLADERSGLQFMEEKLQANKQLLQRVFKEIASCVHEEQESPIVTLRPAYTIAH
jgi:chromosome segregation ATPase